MKTLLVDDHAIFVEGLAALLKDHPDIAIHAITSSGNFALSHIVKDPIDLLITDYSMSDMNGLVLVCQAKSVAPNLKIIMLSMHDEPHIIREVMAVGIDAYILKKYAQQELLHAINTVIKGHQYWSVEVTRALVSTENTETQTLQELTDREIEVLKLLSEEFTSKQIAEKLFISERTVETHRKNLLRKTNSTNTIGLLKYAYAKNLIT
ncbi:MAG TPA: response regulator transcription factor [Sphingobacterium sp.]|nr:response regulator transcription factor [Sphingobacterium sp.]